MGSSLAKGCWEWDRNYIDDYERRDGRALVFDGQSIFDELRNSAPDRGGDVVRVAPRDGGTEFATPMLGSEDVSPEQVVRG